MPYSFRERLGLWLQRHKCPYWILMQYQHTDFRGRRCYRNRLSRTFTTIPQEEYTHERPE